MQEAAGKNWAPEESVANESGHRDAPQKRLQKLKYTFSA